MTQGEPKLTGEQTALESTMQAVGLTTRDASRLGTFTNRLGQARQDQATARDALARTRERLTHCETYMPDFDDQQQALVAAWFESGIRPENSCSTDHQQVAGQHPAEWGRFVERYQRRAYLRSLAANQESRLRALDSLVSTLLTQVGVIEGQQPRLRRIVELHSEIAPEKLIGFDTGAIH